MKIFLWVLAVLAVVARQRLIATLLLLGALALGLWQKYKTPKVVAVPPLPLNLRASVTELVSGRLKRNKWLLNRQKQGSLHYYEQHLVKRIESAYEEIANKLDGKMALLDGFVAFVGASLAIYGVYVALINLLAANLKELSNERALHLFQTFETDKDFFPESWPTFNRDELRKNVLGSDEERKRIAAAFGDKDDYKNTLGGYSFEQAFLAVALEMERDRYLFEMLVWCNAVLLPLSAMLKRSSAYSDSWFTETLLPVAKEAAQDRWNKLVVTA